MKRHTTAFRVLTWLATRGSIAMVLTFVISIWITIGYWAPHPSWFAGAELTGGQFCFAYREPRLSPNMSLNYVGPLYEKGFSISYNESGLWMLKRGLFPEVGVIQYGLTVAGEPTYCRDIARHAWLPLWIPLLVLLILDFFIWRIVHRRPLPGHCEACRYNLTGNTSGVCPECGLVIGGQSKRVAPMDQDPKLVRSERVSASE